MSFSVLLDHLRELLRRLSRFEQPADQVLSQYFRAHAELGRRDRGQLAQAAFHWLRHRRRLDALCADDPSRVHWLAWADSGGPPPQLAEADVAWLDRAARRPASESPTLPPAVRLSLPDWLWAAMQHQYGLAADGQSAEALAQALLLPAPLTLRANTLRTSREQLQQRLAELGIETTPCVVAPQGLHVTGHPALERTDAFAEGCFEVQDEGSQLLALACGAKRGQMVLDLCAGAGGKTLALAAAMRNAGRLYAFDISAPRLDQLKQRARRAGVSNLYHAAIRGVTDERVKRLAGKLDRVLIDAPCTGTGTLRRNPDLKWRQDEAALTRLCATQAALLRGAARLPKPGGWLIYATCSVLAQENLMQVEAFLREHPEYTRLAQSPHVALDGVFHDGVAQWLPTASTDGYRGDGFFVAVLVRAAQ